MAYKRAHRGNCSRISPTVDGGDILSEAMDLYGRTWSITDGKHLDQALPDATEQISFSEESIQRAIKRYPATKSCGIDGIHIVLLKCLVDTELIMLLKGLFDLCLSTGCSPLAWNKALTVLIPKKITDCMVTDSRPISLTVMFRRIFEILLMDHLEESDNGLLNLHRCQAGGRKGYSTVSNVLILDELHTFDRPYTVLLDIKKGFDSVRHSDLLNAITSKSSCNRVNSLLFNLFMNQMETNLVVNGFKTSTLKITRGIFQGSVLSPLLFNVWIDDLIADLNPDDNELPTALAFIDDIVLKCSSHEDCKQLLATCEQWSIERGIQFNTSKSFVIKSQVNSHLQLYAQDLPAVETADYLGVPFTCQGADWNSLLKKQLTAMTSHLGYLVRIGRHWPEWLKLHIYKTFVLSKLNYCSAAAGMWLEMNQERGQDILKKLEQLDKLIVQWLFATNSLNAHATLRSIVQIDKLRDRLSDAKHLFQRQIQRLADSNPWHQVLEKCKTRRWYVKTVMSQLVKQRGLMDKLKKFNEQRDNGPMLTLTQFMMRHRYSRLQKCKGVLHQYIMQRCRKYDYGPDSIIYHPDDTERKLMLDWRRNLLFQRKWCSRCDVSFTRGHLNDCLLMLELPDGWIQNQDRASLLEDHQILVDKSMKEKFEYNGNYTVLDGMLNNKRYSHFLRVIQWLQLKLERD